MKKSSLKRSSSFQRKRFSGAIGQEYTFFEHAFPHFWGLQKTIAEEVAKSIPENAEIFLVLELGCGPGPTTIEILKVNPKIRITAIDNEPIMLKQAKNYLKEFKERIDFVLKDALDYLKEAKDSSFDCVASGWTLHNFPKKFREEVHSEIFRVLKNGGTFVNGDKIAEPCEIKHKTTLDWSLRQFRESAKEFGKQRLGEEWVEHMLRDNEPDLLMPETELIKELKEIGFSEVQIVWRQYLEAVIKAKKTIKKKFSSI